MTARDPQYLTTEQVAARLGITSRRVRALIRASRLPAHKIGRDWIIRLADVQAYEPGPVGYPKGKPRN